MTHLVQSLLATLRAANHERRETLSDPEMDRLAARETVVVMITATLMLVMSNGNSARSFIGWLEQLTRGFIGWLEQIGGDSPVTTGVAEWTRLAENMQLFHLSFWVLAQVTAYLLIPALVVRFVLGRRMADYGWKLTGMFDSWWLYAGMFCFMVPLILAMSRTSSFQHAYPFYKLGIGEPLWPRLIAWEVLYASQFIALEFFFRGFLLHGTRRQLGPYAILAMAVPYCMIHFGKPLPETLASIPAGLVLGFMSLRTRSIWMGAALHIAVAWSMDAAAISSRH